MGGHVLGCIRLQPGPVKGDVSAVTNMGSMFSGAFAFDQDLSRWDVSAVTNMGSMFSNARSFNHDLSRWDASAFTDMTFMFMRADAFMCELAGMDWVNSKANKRGMFMDSSEPISSTVDRTAKKAFTPQSKLELLQALIQCCGGCRPE